jgi:hypothetical protein
MAETINTGTPANFEAYLENNAQIYDDFQDFLDGLNSPGMVDGSTFIITRIYPPPADGTKPISVNLMHQQGAQAPSGIE